MRNLLFIRYLLDFTALFGGLAFFARLLGNKYEVTGAFDRSL
jgi:hypothetical protein